MAKGLSTRYINIRNGSPLVIYFAATVSK